MFPRIVRRWGEFDAACIRAGVRRFRTTKLYWRTGGGEAFAVRQGNWKLVKIGKRTELYDLEADVGESKDAAAVKPEILGRLESARQAWNRQMIAPLFQSPVPAGKKK